jgi:CheY-like chemotaxis protein
MLTVTDTGEGMDSETQARIFEPFFTTKEAGKGTGLGLATVYGIVQQSGGQIRVYSEKGCGTTFKIYLPAAAASSALALVAETEGEREAGGTEVVLVVEDEDAVRTVARRVLERRGYTVLEAATGTEGLQMVERYGGDIHLLLTDLNLPDVNGIELARQVAAARPGIRVLIASGYTEQDLHERGGLEPGAAFLEKPFLSGTLAARVRELLGGEAA